MNHFTNKLDLTFPLVVAPMAGGPSSPEFVIASSQVGALGSIGAAYSTPAQIEEFVYAVRAKTRKSFAINLFIPTPEPKVSEAQLSQALAATRPFRQALNLPDPELKPPYEENFDQQFEMVLKTKPKVLSFVFGLLKPEYVKAAREKEIDLIGTATTLEEALMLEETGIDAITLQGVEAGGHRGIFNPSAEDPEVPLFKLLEQCRGKFKIPLIAAGGLMTKYDVENALNSGADGVQLGTAFLACVEAGTSQPYRDALLASSKRKTKTTRAFSGRLARGIENKFMLEMEKTPEAILPFQAQNKFTRDLRSASVKNNSSDYLSLWSGTGPGELWTGRVSELIHQLF